MKKLFLYIFLSSIFCNISFANNFEYICRFETHFKTSDDAQLSYKKMRFKIYNSGKTVKFYDYEIKNYYEDLDLITNNKKEIIAVKILPDYIQTLVINKNTLSAKYQNMWFDDIGGGEYSIGKCS